MTILKRSTSILFSVLLLSACGGGGDQGKKDGEKGDKKDGSEDKVQTYNYDHSKTELNITTYKHSSKTGVGIGFDSLQVEGVGSDAKSIPELFKDVSFEVPISGLNSGDPTRDPKIREHFFGVMENGSSIEGEVKGMSVEGKEGSASIMVEMNGVEQTVEMDVKNEKGSLTLTGTIDALDWDGQEALDSLQSACEEKHTGDDGKTKLWSEVALELSTELEVRERMAD